MGLYALVCLLPVLLVFIASISDDASLTQKGFSFFPTAFSTKGWDYVFNFGSQLLRSYEVTIFITVVGTALSLIVMSMYAYVLSKKEFMLRRFFTVLLIITLLCILVGCLMGLFSLVGVIASLVAGVLVGALAGYVAGRFMGTETSLGRNILMGILGSFVGEFVFGLFGIYATGSITSFIISVIGACICIWIGQKLFH